MPKKLTFGFVADPPSHFDLEAETTLFLIREIERRGHSVFLCEPKDLFLKQNQVWAKGKNLATLDCLFLRKDPPFDLSYLHHLYLLLKLRGKVLMINDPLAVMNHNEKLSALNFPFAPKTLVTSKRELLLSWAKQFKNGVVLKPLHYSGGVGVRWLKNFKSCTITEQTLCQEYLPAAKKGDKRILLWDGKILGAYLRVPKPGEFRANLHQGGKFVATQLTPREIKIAKTVGLWAKRQRLYFVGMDLIGGYLTEINVTSPMGIREVNVLYHLKVEKTIIDSILRKI